MDKENKEIKAVHERDLDTLLSKISKKEDFYIGKIKCKFCEEIISKENLYSLYSELGSINFICSKPQCIAKFMEHAANRKKKDV